MQRNKLPYPENNRREHGMKQDNIRRGGLWTLLKLWIAGLFGPIERGKYRRL